MQNFVRCSGLAGALAFVAFVPSVDAQELHNDVVYGAFAVRSMLTAIVGDDIACFGFSFMVLRSRRTCWRFQTSCLSWTLR
jgi:hypothetical protein